MLALRSIARRVLLLTAEERKLAGEIETIVRKLAPQLLDQPGVGPHAAAQLVLSWSATGDLTDIEASLAQASAPLPWRSDGASDVQLGGTGDEARFLRACRRCRPSLHEIEPTVVVSRKNPHVHAIPCRC
jgi:transposase